MSSSGTQKRASRSSKRSFGAPHRNSLLSTEDADPLRLHGLHVASQKQARIESTQRRTQLLDDGSGDERDETSKLITKLAAASPSQSRQKPITKKAPSKPVSSPKADSSSQVPPLKKSPSRENGSSNHIKSPSKEISASQPSKPTLKATPSKVDSIPKKSPVAPKSAAPKLAPVSMDVDKFDYTLQPTRYVPPPEKVEKVRPPLPMPVLPTPAPLPPVDTPQPASQISEPQTNKEIVPINKSALPFSIEPFYSEKEPSSPRPRVLLALTGSVATIKLNDLLHLLTKSSDVIVITTKSAEHFATAEKFEDVRFYNDQSEYAMWKGRNDPVLHIELRKWADILIIAPLSANTLAKLANGLCDNLVSCVARAWDFERPFYVAPAMNTLMWTHPFTEKHLSALEDIGVKVIPPIQKTLMCGDKGTPQCLSVQMIHLFASDN